MVGWAHHHCGPVPPPWPISMFARGGEEHPQQMEPATMGQGRLQENLVTTVESEEELLNLVREGKDVVVKLSFPYCRSCHAFWTKYQRFATIYSKTQFVRIVGTLNDSCRHYYREVLKAKRS